MEGLTIILVLLTCLVIGDISACLIAGVVDRRRGKVDSVFKYIKADW